MKLSTLLQRYFLFAFFLSGISLTSCSLVDDFTDLGTSEHAFQIAADVLRLEHIEYYGGLIEEFHEINGFYPFGDIETDLPIYAFIANDHQEENTGGLPFEYYHVSTAEFVAELESGLGREIEEYYDPQHGGMYKPNFYMYLLSGDYYFFAVHISREYSFTQHVDDYYYKVEVTNQVGNNYAVLYDELVDSVEFQDAVSQDIENEDFYREREEDYLHYTKNL